ncbi:MFS transporter [Actinotalea fermentans]|uniref:MFS transporter n=1 Tax=Actinotalea fermentans TaxID=43671 RepID=A0A511YUN2_9CELL|nr:MFS transporter [Actinotalea fermentans]KGM17445.1 MFS transporter [Actinotalea fermentans ATCC 43279 = JCM 9966 = DSM 3133]GEN78904.1 MFS transporter [Actinotalea fermentans]
MARLLLDLTPLRVSVPYRRMWLGTSAAGVGGALTAVVVGLQVYELTGSTASVGLVGLAALGPLVLMGLYGGALVDAHDRRRVILLTALGQLACAVGLSAQAFAHLDDVRVLYALVAVQAGLMGVNSPARMAIVPHLVGTRLLPAANALSSLSMGIASTAGPLLAGVLVAGPGYGATYAVEAVLLLGALAGLASLPPMPPRGEVGRPGLASVLEGVRFLRTRPNVRATFVVDLAAMVLAMPRVLFPAIGATLIGGGATTVGVLTAGIAAGAILGGLFSGPLGRVRLQGRAVVVAVVGWGLSVALFGAVVLAAPDRPPSDGAHWTLWLAAACMVVAGSADTVSAIFRSTILQAATPDALRGRLQGIFIVVVAGGPRLGDVVLGGAAEGVGEAWAAVAGGLACATVVAAFAFWQPRFLAYDADHPRA